MRKTRSLVMFLAVGVLALRSAVQGAGYPETVLGDNPVAYYRFEEAADAETIADETGNGHDSVALNNVVLGAEGAVGKALELNGTDATVELDLQFNPADPEGDGAEERPNDFSIELFLNPAAPGANQVILSQKDGSGLGRSDFLLTFPTSALGTFLGGRTTASSVLPEANTWYHVIMTYDGGSASAFRGVRDGSDGG